MWKTRCPCPASPGRCASTGRRRVQRSPDFWRSASASATFAPCPASGIFVHGAADTVVPPPAVTKLVEKLRTQKHITIHHEEIPRANHFFEKEHDEMMGAVNNYLDFRLDPSCPIR